MADGYNSRLLQDMKEVNNDRHGTEKRFFAIWKEDEKKYPYCHAMDIVMLGPKGTPYEGGAFTFEFKYPKDYPKTSFN